MQNLELFRKAIIATINGKSASIHAGKSITSFVVEALNAGALTYVTQQSTEWLDSNPEAAEKPLTYMLLSGLNGNKLHLSAITEMLTEARSIASQHGSTDEEQKKAWATARSAINMPLRRHTEKATDGKFTGGIKQSKHDGVTSYSVTFTEVDDVLPEQVEFDKALASFKKEKNNDTRKALASAAYMLQLAVQTA